MKNKLMGLLVALGLVGSLAGVGVTSYNEVAVAQEKAEQAQLAEEIEALQEELFVDESEEKAPTNVGDGKEYAYWITEVNGNEVYGKPMNRISSTNAGIFLYKDEIGQDIQVGDKVVVVWGEYEDEFKSIKVLKR